MLASGDPQLKVVISGPKISTEIIKIYKPSCVRSSHVTRFYFYMTSNENTTENVFISR